LNSAYWYEDAETGEVYKCMAAKSIHDTNHIPMKVWYG